jgi:phosphotransferase system HPr (HPr) family protein
MAELHLTVIDPTGLHARPAARFVQVASRFTSRIALRHDGR